MLQIDCVSVRLSCIAPERELILRIGSDSISSLPCYLAKATQGALAGSENLTLWNVFNSISNLQAEKAGSKKTVVTLPM